MGMDVYGQKPSAPEGKYFRNNVWAWRPLWDFVCEKTEGLLTEKQKKFGHDNRGILIGKKAALAIASRLDELVSTGAVSEFEKARQQRLNTLPDETCEHCQGTGKRADLDVRLYNGGCNGCHGSGKIRPIETWYSFDLDNVAEFSRFVRSSGGFRIR
jgi:hypothetical protein